MDSDHAPKLEVVSPSTEKNAGSGIDSGVELVNSQDLPVEAAPSSSANNVIQSDAKQGLVEESAVGIRIGMMRAKVEEASSSPKLESPKNHDRVESTTTSTKPSVSIKLFPPVFQIKFPLFGKFIFTFFLIMQKFSHG